MNITTIVTQMTILLLIMIVGFVGAKKNIFNDASFFLRKAKRFENVSAEMVQCVITPFYISHDRKSFLLIFPAGYCHNIKLFLVLPIQPLL